MSRTVRSSVVGHTASRAALPRIATLPRALRELRKRDRVPIATVLPSPSYLKTSVSENASNALVRELVAIFGVNRFAWHEVKIKFCVLNIYNHLLRTFKVHLDPRLDGIPKHAMTEASGVKGGPQFFIKA